MYRYANPTAFLKLSAKLLPLVTSLALLCLAFGVYFALFDSPADYQQGEAVRIMYVHVPAAWMALMIYSVIAVSSAVFLIWRHILADLAAEASALPGAAVTLITLVTGSIWGKPMWGAWWVWDARLTSMLILFFLYLGYISLRDTLEPGERQSLSAAVLALVGFINIPIIKFSVDWWNTLHQPASILRTKGIAIDPSMQYPLFTMAAGFFFAYLALLLLRMRTILHTKKLRRKQYVRLT